MAMFLEPEFPICLSAGSSAIPTYSTAIASSGSGWRQTNARRSRPLGKFNAATSIRNQDELDQLIEFFHAMKGMATPFRFRDMSDYKSCYVSETITDLDEVLVASAAGGENDFILQKTYAVGSISTVRQVTQPEAATVVVAIDDVNTTAFTITDGVLVMDSDLGVGEKLSVGFHYWLPMTFASDELPTSLAGYLSGSITVPLLEFPVEPE